jgi:hypothetical protein
MALRAFRLNPSLGGFGGESAVLAPRPKTTAGAAKTHRKAKGSATGRNSDIAQLSDEQHSTCDAFAQIVKELVDNAVDACSTGATLTLDSTPSENQGESSASKRVRVVIQPEKMTATEKISENELGIEDANETHNVDEVLRVSVSDNGCGMENIQNCVEAFQTNKAGNITQNEKSSQRVDNSNEGIDSQEKKNDEPNLTAGRYGIGLTLCLLHAQRLVPDSCASITSATASSIQWTRASYVVDTEGDTVRCVKKEHLPKKRRDESGTAISLLVPVRISAIQFLIACTGMVEQNMKQQNKSQCAQHIISRLVFHCLWNYFFRLGWYDSSASLAPLGGIFCSIPTKSWFELQCPSDGSNTVLRTIIYSSTYRNGTSRTQKK